MKVGIVTLNGYENFGNRLQNYALQEVVKGLGFEVDTLWTFYPKQMFKYFLKILIPVKAIYKKHRYLYLFSKKYIKTKFISKNANIADKYDYFICGSDQVWNYSFKSFNKRFFLDFSPKEKNIAYAASFGVNKIEEEYIEEFSKGLNNFKAISVRENEGKQIINKLDKSLDVDVVLDPTLLVDVEVWNNVSRKPSFDIPEKYILIYMLGENSAYSDVINKVAQEKNLSIVNIMDKNSKYYSIGPAEFLYLEKNANLICTDSFHSAVFGFLFDRSFVVFDRVDKSKNMSSRLNSLLTKFKLENRKFNGSSITDNNINHNYTKAYKVLEIEKEESINFLRESLELRGD